MTQKRTLDLDKVLVAGIDLVNELGLEGATLPNLAKRLGIRSQSLYHYLSGRKELLSLVGAREIGRLHQQLVSELLGLSGETALLKFADVTRDFILNNSALAAVLFHINEYDLSDAISQAILELIDLGEKLNLRQGRTIAFHAVIGSVLGYAFLDRSSFFKAESREKANEEYHEMILRLVQPSV